MSIFNFFNSEEKELRQLQRQYRNIEIGIEKRKLRANLQTSISKYNILKNIDKVEWSLPQETGVIEGNTLRLQNLTQPQTVKVRTPYYDYNQSDYPFQEKEQWNEVKFEGCEMRWGAGAERPVVILSRMTGLGAGQPASSAPWWNTWRR